jgi:hypothetical protein
MCQSLESASRERGAQSKHLYTRRRVRNSSPLSLRLNTYSNPSPQGCQTYIVQVEVEAIHNRGATEWRKRGTGLPGTEAEAGLHYRVHVGQCSGGNTKMGMNSTDIFYDQGESILHGAESECAWGVLPHRVRRTGISGTQQAWTESEWIGVNRVHRLMSDGDGVVGYR